MQRIEYGTARRHGEWASRQGARLIHGTRRGDELHERSSTPIRADGNATSDHLAEACHIGPHAVELLRAAIRDAKPCHHLVEHEDRAVPLREVAHSLEE